MSTPKHTPGPWIKDDRHIHPSDGRLTYPVGQEPETDVIVLVDTDMHANGLLNETDQANLSLIAAAPDLLDACKRAYANLEMSEAYNLVDALKAAIDKAEGRA